VPSKPSSDPTSDLLANCVVVLVRPHYAGNVGAVARVMWNMGARELALVAPIADPSSRAARKRSTHGESILDAARCVSNLSEALAGCVAAAATSARPGDLIRSHATVPRLCAVRLARLLAESKVALVFGPEPSGLTNEEISLCQHLISIPADPGYPALNLAQSVGICLYELRMATLDPGDLTPEPRPAEFSLQQRMFEALERSLVEIHYLFGEKAPVLMHAIRQLISRANPTETEVKLLLGLARQMSWIAKQKASPPPSTEGTAQPDGMCPEEDSSPVDDSGSGR
jgi:tRNA/rRNA methyltransferase